MTLVDLIIQYRSEILSGCAGAFITTAGYASILLYDRIQQNKKTYEIAGHIQNIEINRSGNISVELEEDKIIFETAYVPEASYYKRPFADDLNNLEGFMKHCKIKNCKLKLLVSKTKQENQYDLLTHKAVKILDPTYEI